MTGTASDSPKMRIAKTITNGFETIGLNAVSTIIRKELTIIAIQHQKVIKALRIPFKFLIPTSLTRIVLSGGKSLPPRHPKRRKSFEVWANHSGKIKGMCCKRV